MFEQELELEQKEGGGFGPVLVIIALVVAIVGGLGYFVFQSQQSVKPEEASKIVSSVLQARGFSKVTFQTGHLTTATTDRFDAPHIKLLSDAGIIAFSNKKQWEADVALTATGEKMITSIPEFQKKLEDDKTATYVVPLANRELVEVTKIEKLASQRFRVEYTWKWKPNEVGQIFDASGKYIHEFPVEVRAQLIDKYGADFYNGAAVKGSITVVKGNNGWQPAAE